MKTKLSLLLILILHFNIFAQFGKNKIQYKDFNWYYIQTEHFDIYFNDGGETLTEFVAHAAEDALNSIQNSFNYKINKRIPLIVYNSQNDFQETNVVDIYLSEGIQGFTELFKNRVVVQFTGSYKQFRHLIHHELIHAVMNDMFYGGSIQNIISNNITLSFPIWFTEGLAEYESLNWDVDTDMFIRDAVINGTLPELMQLDGYFAYRGGQSVISYIANKYGKQKISELLHKIKGTGNFEEAFKKTIGIELKEFGERWKKDVRKKYWPDIATRDDVEDFARRLTNKKDNDGFFNSSPAISPQGDKIVFISNRDFYFDVFLMDAASGKILKKIVYGNRTPDFEELNILTPGLTWSPDGKHIALSVKSGPSDIIHIIDINTETKQTLPFKLDAISSVNWSRDGKKLVFIGQNSKQSDIYLYDFDSKQLTNLTNDIWGDYDPVWSYDNTNIFFSSDRQHYLNVDFHLTGDSIFKINQYQKDIYCINVNDRSIKRVTNLPRSDEFSAIVDSDGKNLIFISDINGINNIYTIPISNSVINSQTELKPITNSLSGLYQLSLSYDSKKIVFSTLYKSSFNIFLMNNPFEPKTKLNQLEPTLFIKELENQNYNNISINPNKEISTITTESENQQDSISIFTGNFLVSSDTAGNTEIDYSRYIFGPQGTFSDTTEISKTIKPNDNLDEYGNFRVRKYKVTFGPDIIYANAGYSTFYGLIGTTILSFSDVLGDHRLIGVTGLQIDLKNSDYGLAYYNMKGRINFGIEGFHTARFVELIRGNYIYLYRFRNLQLSLNANYPLDRFYRFEAGLSYMNVISENLYDIKFPLHEDNYLVPSLSFVHDNILWGYTAPIEGTRYRVDTYGNPGIGKKTLSFWTLMGDYRTYFRFFTDYSFAVRFSAGYSSGANAQRFFLGGTENWINRSFATAEIPFESTSDFAFLTVVMPLRGFNYSERIGTKFALANYELRFPLIRYIIPAGIPVFFRNILGVIFLDAGTTWTDNNKLQLFNRNQNNEVKTKDLLIGTGVGSRVYLFGFILKFDLAWSYHIERWSKPKFYFSLGLDF